jgi:hypothetical protein
MQTHEAKSTANEAVNKRFEPVVMGVTELRRNMLNA